MVATFPKSESTQTLFPYLKPCKPAPGVAAATIPKTARDPFDCAPPKKGRRQRWLPLLMGSAQVVALSLGLWASALPQTTQPAWEAATQQEQDGLWNILGSKKLAQVLLDAKAKQTEAALADAERSRLQAQQLRLEAEAQAQQLTTKAATQARQKTVEAMRLSDLIALDATYIGAEQVIYAEPGDDITLKFAARIQCKDGDFGETAIAAPVDSRIAAREVLNLDICYPSPETAAGEPVGQAGEWGVAFFKVK